MILIVRLLVHFEGWPGARIISLHTCLDAASFVGHRSLSGRLLARMLRSQLILSSLFSSLFFYFFEASVNLLHLMLALL